MAESRDAQLKMKHVEAEGLRVERQQDQLDQRAKELEDEQTKVEIKIADLQVQTQISESCTPNPELLNPKI